MESFFYITILFINPNILTFRRGGEKREEKKNKFRNIPPQLSDISSSKYGYSNGHDPRIETRRPEPMLPKVGSTGLWVGAPSMYSRDPSDAYYNDKKRSSSLQRPVQRTASELKSSGQRTSLSLFVIWAV